MNLSGDDDELEFLLRRSIAASLQNSTQRGVLEPSKDLREKYEEDDVEEEDDEDDPLNDLCFWSEDLVDAIVLLSMLIVVMDSRSKKSDKSNPQQKIRSSST